MKLKNNIKAVFVDVDRTLTSHKKHNEVSLENINALKLLQAQKIHVIIATGRDFETAKIIHDQIKRNEYSKYLVHSNGSALSNMEEEKLIYDRQIDKEKLKDLLEYLKSKKYLIKLPMSKIIYYPNKRFRSRVIRTFLSKKWEFQPYSEMPSIEETNGRKIGWFTGYYRKKTKKLAAEIMGIFPDLEVVRTGSGIYLEATALGISKGTAVDYLMNKNKWKKEELVALGDSMNDFEMFTRVGTAIAMKNALPELMEVAHFETDTAQKNGVAKAIASLGKINIDDEKVN